MSARRYAGAAVYGLLVFLGTALLGFVVMPVLGHASGRFPIETEASAVFSLVTLKAVPFLAGLSVAAALSYEWLVRLPLTRRIALYFATTLLAWLVGAAFAVLILG